jgi:hypothetical protein
MTSWRNTLGLIRLFIRAVDLGLTVAALLVASGRGQPALRLSGASQGVLVHWNKLQLCPQVCVDEEQTKSTQPLRWTSLRILPTSFFCFLFLYYPPFFIGEYVETRS